MKALAGSFLGTMAILLSVAVEDNGDSHQPTKPLVDVTEQLRASAHSGTGWKDEPRVFVVKVQDSSKENYVRVHGNQLLIAQMQQGKDGAIDWPADELANEIAVAVYTVGDLNALLTRITEAADVNFQAINENTNSLREELNALKVPNRNDAGKLSVEEYARLRDDIVKELLSDDGFREEVDERVLDRFRTWDASCKK